MITQEKVLTNIARMMGMTTLPQGELDDWKEYAQTAFDYAWRYYKWDWSTKIVTVDLQSSPYLPADFDPGGYQEAIGGNNGSYRYATQSDFISMPADTRAYTLEYDATLNKYKVLTRMSGVPTIDFIYQTAPPTLSNDTPVQFPSAMAIAIGASIYAKQAENPTRADITQEWDEFHAELDRQVGRMEVYKPQGVAMNLYDLNNTFTGDTR